MFFLQTDQRIVFHNSKAVRFSNSGGEKAPAGRKKSSASQTRWELKDKEVQVHSHHDLGLRVAEERIAVFLYKLQIQIVLEELRKEQRPWIT